MSPADIAQTAKKGHPSAGLAEVMAQLAAEVAVPLTQALHRVVNLAHDGSIDRTGLQALLDEIGNARRAGLMGQQIARFANGQAQPAIEQVSVSQVLRDVLDEHVAHAVSGAAGHRHDDTGLMAMGDVSLVHTLVQAAVGWTSHLTNGTVQWSVERAVGQPDACLTAHFDRASSDQAEQHPGDASLDWLLMSCAADLAGVTVSQTQQGLQCQLALRFRHTVSESRLAEVIDDQALSRRKSSPLSGCQVLVVAAQSALRKLVGSALHGHDVFIDQVPSVEAAERYCDDGSPQALVYEGRLNGPAMRALRARLAKLTPEVAVVAVLASSDTAGMDDQGQALGIDTLDQSLAPWLNQALGRPHRGSPPADT